MDSSRQASPSVPDFIASPDYVTFSPCQHLQQVMSTQAKNTALRNYRLALKVSLLYTQKNVSYKSPESSSIIDHSSILALRSKLLKCKVCSNNCGSLFMCLQCNHIGCFKKGHAFSHAKSAGHVFGIDAETGNMFCFRCGDFVGHPEMEGLRIRHIEESNGNQQGLQIFKVEEDLAKTARINESSHLPSYKATTGLRGFINMGATCFMSSVIQTLIHNPLIREHFLAGNHIRCDKDPSNCIPCCLDEIFTVFYSESETSGFGPTSLLTAAWKVKRSLAGYSEQDAHEFWQFILDELHKSDLTLASSTHTNGNDPVLKKIHSHHTSSHDCPCITHRTFSGQLQSSIECSKCERVTTTVDMMLDLSLEVAQPAPKKVAGKTLPTTSLKLTDCLTRFTTSEKLDVLYSCDTCGHKTMAYKQLQIKKLPPVLAIQLKRFEHLSVSSKIETHVQFPLILDMNNYVLQPENGQQRSTDDLSYELFAVVCHIGSVNTGHYVCMVKNRDNNWFKFDDAKVSLVSKQDVLNTKAYLLYYIAHELD